MYVSVDIHEAFLTLLAVLSIIGNCLLIFLVLHHQNRTMGNYRILLVTFASVDMIISIFHCYAVPLLYQFEFGVIVFTSAGLNHPFGFFINASYVILFYEPFVLLAFHFIYRYLSLVSPHQVHQRGLHLGIIAISITIIYNCANFVVCFLLKDVDVVVDTVMLKEFHVNMHSSPRPNIIAVHYFRPNGEVNWMTFTAVGITFTTASATLFVSALCAHSISNIITQRVMAIVARNQQLQLLRALIAQFMVPFALCIIPFAFFSLLPFTGYQFGHMGNLLGMMASLFPVIDPLMVIIMISRRDAEFVALLD